jgi:hypothetical protein
MLEKFWRYVNKGEEEKRSALKPDDADQERTENPDWEKWSAEAGQAGLEGETSEESHEFTAGELHAKFDTATAKQIAEKKLNHPHLELVESKPSKPAVVVKETKNPFAENQEGTNEKERELLMRLNNAEAEIAAIRAELLVLKAKKRIEVA